ncbi:MAG: Smr/MutS family protein [Spirochaetaceae bacterium]|jgi:DNA mismatch repair protein MutS2|nr:Smr/MutS family protein [Spirochaetaceae bacterium]
MNDKTRKLLEFDLIRRRVAESSLSGEAARRLEGELPLTDPREVEELKKLVAEFMDKFNSAGEEPRGGFPDIGFLIPKLEVEGMVLELDEAYALGVFVRTAEALKEWLRGSREDRDPPDDGHWDSAPPGEKSGFGAGPGPLQGLVSELPDCSPLAREIFRVLDKDGSLRDLPEFRAIKGRIRNLTEELEAIASRYTGNEETRRMLQSTLPSQRDGRMVLAVKANFRGRIKGIVHEVSSTGQTLFVEPEAVVDKNNEILIEKRRLDGEIHRVLREMTGRIATQRSLLKELHEKIIHLETLRARARYSRETRGHFALDGDSGRRQEHEALSPVQAAGLVLRQARHPLLGSKAVPVDISMGGTTRTVIITGPNTGGKTVTLKIVGLFALMNQFGLALPAGEGTILPVFDGVYADIGDEQSIAQSLSTFSAHMTNIAAITAAVTENSLVLLDELGSGTDPEEGSAIAMAILDHLIAKKARVIATTHHGILKNYGFSREGVENASVEFDGQTLSPTYRIIMGIPGESRAVEIAARNGLPQDIVSTARTYLNEERTDVSALITGLKKKHQELDAAAEAGKAEILRLREERRRSDLKELRLRQKEIDLKTGGMGSLRLLLAESRKTLENLVRELKEGEITREKTVAVKEFLAGLEKSVAAEDEVLEKEGRSLAEERRRLETEDIPGQGRPSRGKGGGRGNVPPAIGPGTEVLAGDYQRRGTVLRADKKGSWVVEIGSLRMSIPEKDLIPLEPSGEDKKPLIAVPDLSPENQARFELNLLGMRLEEALEVLRRQIDAATLAGLREFSVIHGKGDGILQRGVHEFLKQQGVVTDYYFSRPEMGGFGRTEVVLKG